MRRRPHRRSSGSQHYIRKWQGSSYATAVKRAQDWAHEIAEEFRNRIYPHFFLSGDAGKQLRDGQRASTWHAKGMWQLTPETARRFGLKTGPLVAFPRADRDDDRQQWEKSTGAAARYIKEIYSTDAQASGLLVMAAYNWGEGRIINLLRTMPANPRERNFWKVLEQHRDQVPKETYDYVLSIVSAAVIGENPRMFGFAFDNPLAFIDRQ